MEAAINDNAYGGKRGLRKELTPSLAAYLRRMYDLPSSAELKRLGGSDRLNFLAYAKDGQPLVLRVYRPGVSQARLCDLQTIQTRLRGTRLQGEIPLPSLIPSVKGDTFCQYEDCLVDAEGYIEHNGRMNTLPYMQKGMPLLGRIHTLLEDLRLSEDGERCEFVNHIGAKDALAAVRAAALRIQSWENPTPDELRLARESIALAERLLPLEPSLPCQMTHGDFWDNNILFRNGSIVGVLDLGFATRRPRIDDLALTLYFADLQFLRYDPLPGDRIARIIDLISRYQSALSTPLTRQELLALPLAMARQPLWGMGVWVGHLDDEAAARRHAEGIYEDILWAMEILDQIDLWQDALIRLAR